MIERNLSRAQSADRFAPRPSGWREVFDDTGRPRPIYEQVVARLTRLRPGELHTLDEKLEATLKEMGVMFSTSKPQNLRSPRPWLCDVLPAMFAAEEWLPLAEGIRQRIRAFEALLSDVYSERAILRAGVLPIHVVLGSPYFLKPTFRLKPPGEQFLHLSGVCVTRTPDGKFAVKNHHLSQAPGISYMMQNRRVIARVAPDLFSDIPVASVAETPTAILETLRAAAQGMDLDPTVVMLSAGPESPDYTEHSFLARRMGIPLVQGRDLLVLDNLLYLKTVGGLDRVEVVYTRLPDDMLDPLVLNRQSAYGVPGLVQCVRLGTVKVINSLGSRLADDRSLLPFAHKIIRFYLGETPILPTVPTLLCGDIDQREMVLGNLEKYRILPLTGEHVLGNKRGLSPSPREEHFIRTELRKNPDRYVAQPIEQDATTVCFQRDTLVQRAQDHIVFALRSGEEFDVFPGCLTRVSSEHSIFTATELGGGSKDSWVLTEQAESSTLHDLARLKLDTRKPTRHVTSRVAESFYWLGRYLERSYHLAYMIQVIETLEAEELNSAERKLYRPVWNKLLPPLDAQVAGSRRNIGNTRDRYKLILDPAQMGSLHNTFARAIWNAESVLEALSPEAWSSLNMLRAHFNKSRFNAGLAEGDCAKATRRVADSAVQNIRQFFGTAACTMLHDDGWMFCEIGESVERAVITANAVASISDSLIKSKTTLSHSSEIELSAFLRLLGTRDAYRRVYQMRAEPLGVLEILWQNPEAPRSVLHCMHRCITLLTEALPETSAGRARTIAAVRALAQRIVRTDWPSLLAMEQVKGPERTTINELLSELLGRTMEIDTYISDSFLNHQANLTEPKQTFLTGFSSYAI